MLIKLMMIGCGGTGGCFFSKFIRFMADFSESDIRIEFAIVDGDHVEKKNIGRQPFIPDDIGKNKAVALATAADEALHVNIRSYPFYLSSSNEYRTLSWVDDSEADVGILIGAVDNHACRKIMHSYFNRSYSYSEAFFYIDSANEFSSGEVVFGKRIHNTIIAPDRCHYYPDILDDAEKPVYEKSCEELNQSAPQHLATNSMASDIIFSYVTQLITAGEMASRAPGGICYFDSMKMFCRFDPYMEARHGKIE